jgi:hypothetical protein
MACAAGQICAGSACVVSCPAGLASCAGSCVVTANDPANCGGCGVVCPARANAATVCVSGDCNFVCSAGFADCDLAAGNGCEASLRTSSAHCGACGVACAAGRSCVAGACVTTCPAGSVCLSGTPDPSMVFNTPVACYAYPNNLVNGIWHRASNQIIAGHYSSSGYWSHTAGASGYPGSPDNATGTVFARMVIIPGTNSVVHTDQAPYPSNHNRLYIGTINPVTGALGTFAPVVFSDGFTGQCNLLSSSATEFLCFDGTSIRHYATTAGSAALTFVRTVTPTGPAPYACGAHCFGGTFAWDGMFYYFSADGASSSNLLYDVYNTAGARVGRYTANGNGSLDGLYFDWSIGRYASHDGYGGRTGAANFTPTGIGFGNDSQCYGAASPYHAP